MIGNFPRKHLYRSPVPVKLRGMSCDFITVGLYQEHFQKNIETLFRDRYSTKTTRPFIFKIKTLYFFNELSRSTIFEHDKHVMITILNNQMDDICFENIHDDKKKAKI